MMVAQSGLCELQSTLKTQDDVDDGEWGTDSGDADCEETNILNVTCNL
jgi:hypothetical protein